ncbi:NACHT, LRR and PYD domains-containing protein 9A-like isoform X3 [Microtus oregoni]|uniref:NACHT, LRR and PYD domains-containing protein 9A-like isoform X3 n=1 Tax=Microtus oregoni TaxID=111838 RepID=UPI001BB29ED7|nr:NACHT, LRR and PYD domains-containing protein 9A-like isoform X3 [Microtus oregoni]
MAESSGLGVAHCLKELSDAKFLHFKILLIKEPELQVNPVLWANIKLASRTDLITLLNSHYPGQVWDIMSRTFLQVNRRDLWTKFQELRKDKRTYKEIMKTAFHHIWTFEDNLYVLDAEYEVVTGMQYKVLQEVFDPQLKPVTAVILGAEAIGKTTFLRKAMLDWASGNLWKNRFQYVFFFSLVSLNSTTELSLAQLLLSQLSASSETLDDVLSDPRKILFILDGFDHLKFDLELRTNLCDDWRKTLPTQIVLSSLIQKVMLPESSLLLELGNPSIPKIYHLLQYPREITMGGLNKASRKFYYMSFFGSYQKGRDIFNFLKTMQPLLSLCRNPYMCWMFCRTIKGQCDRGEEMNLVYEPDSALYTSFMVSSFRSVYDNHPSRENRARLKTLCTLAAEGMWKQVFVFKSEDLRRNGITEPEQTSWLRIRFLNYRGDCFMFYHPTLQSYFAALFYFLRQDKDTPHPIIGSLLQFLREVYAHGQTQWLRTGMFVFGIATEKVAAMLNPHFGFIPSRDVRGVIFNCFRNMNQEEFSKTLRSQSLFKSLFGNKEEEFVTQVMGLFEEMTVDISNVDVFTVATYSLLRSQKLKKLHLHIQERVFSETYNPGDGDIETFRRHKKCSFMTNFGDGTLFHTVLQLPHLTSLNLYGTKLSNNAVEKMCSGLKSPTCNLEELLLGKCGILSNACIEIVTSLNFGKLKHLSLVENPVENKGVMVLCEILKDPSCVLEKLMLSYCSLTLIVCGHLSEALVRNKHLSLLDLESNVLEDLGANILCEALKDPKCLLQELWLSGCCLTSDCCEQISTVLTCNENLKTLKLGNNNIQDRGVMRLCEALRNPACKLQSLGLDMCALTIVCWAGLASAVSTCRTLTRLSLDWVTLDHYGVRLLCEALACKGCSLKVLGLDISALSEESQKLLQEVEKKSNLNILHYPWVKEENKMRGVRLLWNSKN